MEYDNGVHFDGVRFIFGPHLAIIGPREARADLMPKKIRAAKESYARKINIITIITHFCTFTPT